MARYYVCALTPCSFLFLLYYKQPSSHKQAYTILESMFVENNEKDDQEKARG